MFFVKVFCSEQITLCIVYKSEGGQMISAACCRVDDRPGADALGTHALEYIFEVL